MEGGREGGRKRIRNGIPERLMMNPTWVLIRFKLHSLRHNLS
jgi:hypothetical protein